MEGISTSILKDCLLICKLELTYLYNLSLHTGMFPSGWKNSVITPIPKEGNGLLAGNWRPINYLCSWETFRKNHVYICSTNKILRGK